MPSPKQIIKPSSELSKMSKWDLEYYIYEIGYKSEQYVKNVVIPAKEYFELRDHLLQKSSPGASAVGAFIHFMILCFFTIDEFTSGAYTMSMTLQKLLCIISLVVFAVAIAFISNLIYKHTFKIERFRFNDEYFESKADEAVKTYSYYGINKSDALNNYIIFRHSYYLNGIKKQINKRSKADIAFLVIALITLIAPVIYGAFLTFT